MSGSFPLTPAQTDLVNAEADIQSRRRFSLMSQIGYLELDVLVTENLSLPSDVTKYPIEDGSEISDHITQGSEELTITGSIATASSFGLSFSGFCKSKLIDAVD